MRLPEAESSHGGVDLGEDVLAVAEASNGWVEFGEVPVSELWESALDERPVVGRGRRTHVLGQGCAELFVGTAIGRVVLVVG
jgi:hypothetical protein